MRPDGALKVPNAGELARGICRGPSCQNVPCGLTSREAHVRLKRITYGEAKNGWVRCIGRSLNKCFTCFYSSSLTFQKIAGLCGSGELRK